ncbi:MAG: tRNA (adenosine(37)-N6)-threonylcarbamoyltransferase complex transferase subunit TsaD [Clostridia bacterium]|nr:tRNA (adenosine(37)-N6)-threonylcarbamoyltransferase complex transferase subunit TsaD [Clostridia bacterium]
MKILAIESSCDETAAAVVRDGREILSDIVASQVETHALYGGVVPEIASRMHAEAIVGVTREALAQAGCTLEEIDAVAVTCAPGLIGALLVGVNFAKGLSLAAGLPLVPVHHLRAHIAANYLEYPALEPPFLCLVASGGHSHIIRVRGYTEFEVLGRTRDDAAGEAFDKAARVFGFPYPGGLHIDRAAADGDAKAVRFPRPQVDGSPYDFSFSGLKTAAVNYAHGMNQKGISFNKNDAAASFQAAVVDILAGRLMLAAKDFNEKTIVLAGGVAANSGLRERLTRKCAERGLPLYMPPLRLCGDNAAMVGAQGYYEYLAGHTAGLDLNACANMEV